MLLFGASPVFAADSEGGPGKKWKPTDVKSCSFDVKRFNKLNATFEWDTWPERVETVYTLLVPLLFVAALGVWGILAASSRTSFVLGASWSAAFTVLTVLFIWWMMRLVGVVRCYSHGADYLTITALATTFVCWHRVAELRGLRKSAMKTDSNFCRHCVELVERIYHHCPRCGKPLDPK